MRAASEDTPDLQMLGSNPPSAGIVRGIYASHCLRAVR